MCVYILVCLWGGVLRGHGYVQSRGSQISSKIIVHLIFSDRSLTEPRAS